MEHRNRDNLSELLGRFLGVEEGDAAAQEVSRGEQLLELYPAPAPDPRVLAGIKQQMVTRAGRHRRLVQWAYRVAPAAAAVIAMALLVWPGHRPSSRPEASYASVIPTAIWESDDINADDVELAYLAAEIEQIEAQLRALDADDGDGNGANTLGEVEVELMRIDTEFWKE